MNFIIFYILNLTLTFYFCSKLVNNKIMALEITDSNFEELVMKSDKPVLVDFWAEWCGPCRMVGPIVEELSKEYEGRAIIGKVDVDSNSMISGQLGIRNIPTLLIFKDGKIVDKQVGAVAKSVLAGKLDAQLA
jgi:thioredoxin 1